MPTFSVQLVPQPGHSKPSKEDICFANFEAFNFLVFHAKQLE